MTPTTPEPIGLPGSGSPSEFLLALLVLFGVPATVLALGRLFDSYAIDIWRRE